MRPRRLLALPVLVVLALLAPPGTPASAAAPSRPLTVMSRNIYLGADLGPAIGATSQFGFLTAVAGIYGTMLASDFPTRAGAIADEVAADDPDLIGLQEVSTWTVAGQTQAPSLDFLAILQAQLAARGLHYDVAAVAHNASIGPVPLLGVGCTGGLLACTLTFADRDVILVRSDRAGLSVGNPRTGRFTAQQLLTTPVGQLSFDRGWATVDGTLDGRPFRFASTHLEVEGFAAVQQAQAQEFLAVAKAPRAVIAVGDFNSAADGSTTTSYADLTSSYFRDAASGVGFTCCQSSRLDDPVSDLTSRIDLVLTHGAVLPVDAHRVGDVALAAGPPYWPSDHAGVVATLRLP